MSRASCLHSNGFVTFMSDHFFFFSPLRSRLPVHAGGTKRLGREGSVDDTLDFSSDSQRQSSATAGND